MTLLESFRLDLTKGKYILLSKNKTSLSIVLLLSTVFLNHSPSSLVYTHTHEHTYSNCIHLQLTFMRWSAPPGYLFFRTSNLYRERQYFQRINCIDKPHSCFASEEESIFCLWSGSMKWFANCCFLWKDYSKFKMQKDCAWKSALPVSIPAL
jgi:hypothetical protein